MQQSRKAAALLMCFSALAISACDTKRVIEHLPTPPERLVCEPAGDRPAVPPEYAIDWQRIQTVAQARAEHEKFVSVLRTREGIVAGYIVGLEGKLFTCWTNMRWRVEYEAGL